MSEVKRGGDFWELQDIVSSAIKIKNFCKAGTCEGCPLSVFSERSGFSYCGIISGSERPSEWKIKR